MKTIAIFNNKGGVGKTTIATMLGFMLASRNNRVLVIDLDPQSNTTQTVLDEQQIDRIYNPKTEAIRIKTIMDIIEPMRSTNEPKIGDVKPTIYSSKKHGFKFDIIPSSLKLSIFEDTLSRAWDDVKGSQIGGFRRTNWARQLFSQVEKRYDYVLIDLSPNLGALNRSVMLNIDHFIIPTTGDIYNQYGVSNIGPWIKGWIKDYGRGVKFLSEDYSEDYLKTLNLNLDTSEENYIKLLGFIQNRVKFSERNKYKIITWQEKFFEKIALAINNNLNFSFTDDIQKDLKLGTIKEVNSLLSESQNNTVPVVKRVYDAMQNEKKWGKRDVENAEYAVYQTFSDILDNVMRNLEKVGN